MYISWKGMVVVKKKIQGIFLALTLLVGISTIYAKVDSESNFARLYENTFQRGVSVIGSKTLNLAGTSLNYVRTFALQSKEEIDARIEIFQYKQVNKAVAGIVDYRNDIKSQVLRNDGTDMVEENLAESKQPPTSELSPVKTPEPDPAPELDLKQSEPEPDPELTPSSTRDPLTELYLENDSSS